MIGSLVGSTFAGAHGTLTITAYDATTGVASYTYELTSATTDLAGIERDTFTLSVSDGTVSSPDAVLAIDIVDDVSNAVNDTNTVAEDTIAPITGNVLTNDLHPNGQPGADTPTSFVSWASTAANYGTFTDTGNGTYRYVLDNTNPLVQGLDGNETLTETFSYTMRDADGDLDTATLTITITSTNDTPSLVVDQGNPLGANDQVFKSGLAAGSAAASDGEFATGTFTLSDADGLDDIASVTITGLAASTVLIGSLVGSTFAGAHGTLTITAYNDTTGVASYTYELTSATTDLAGIERDTFTLSVSDGTVSSPDAVLAIDIVDDGPEIFGIEKVVLANTGGVFTGTIYVHYGADGSNALSPATVIVPTDADPVTTNSGLVITSWDNLPGITETLSADGKTLTATFEEGGGTFYVLQVDDAANTYTLTYSERPVVKLGLDFGAATGGPGYEYLDVPAGSDPLPDFTVRFNGGIFNGTKLVDLGQVGAATMLSLPVQGSVSVTPSDKQPSRTMKAFSLALERRAQVRSLTTRSTASHLLFNVKEAEATTWSP